MTPLKTEKRRHLVSYSVSYLSIHVVYLCSVDSEKNEEDIVLK